MISYFTRVVKKGREFIPIGTNRRLRSNAANILYVEKPISVCVGLFKFRIRRGDHRSPGGKMFRFRVGFGEYVIVRITGDQWSPLRICPTNGNLVTCKESG